MEPSEFAKQLGIEETGSNINDVFTIILKDSDEYAKIYTLLDNSDLVKLDGEDVDISENNSILIYYNDDFTLTLSADLDNDDYNLTIENSH
jgi:hypothetical protein